MSLDKVLGALNAGEMPPDDQRKPTAAEKADLLEQLSVKLVAGRKALIVPDLALH